MGKYWETNAFRKDQLEWYKKIKDEGFEDIEWLNPDPKKEHRGQLAKQDANWHHNEARETYFRYVCFHLHEHDWSSKPRQKRVWEMHSQGYEVAQILKAENYTITRADVLAIIRKYRGNATPDFGCKTRERRIWEHHCNGLSVAETLKIERVTKYRVHKILNEHKALVMAKIRAGKFSIDDDVEFTETALAQFLKGNA